MTDWKTYSENHKRLSEAATPGPWEKDERYVVMPFRESHGARPGGEVGAGCSPTVPGHKAREWYPIVDRVSNAALIAHNREAADVFREAFSFAAEVALNHGGLMLPEDFEAAFQRAIAKVRGDSDSTFEVLK